jgi:GABA(A) receptor-associated protein
MASNFQELSLEERKVYVANLVKNNPKLIPVILTLDKKSTLPLMTKKGYLIPRTFKVTQLMEKLKKEGKISSDKAIYFFINNSIVRQSVSFSELSVTHDSEDGAIHLRVTDIPTFG